MCWRTCMRRGCQPPRLRLVVQAVSGVEALTHYLIAEVRASEPPEEVVLLEAHFYGTRYAGMRRQLIGESDFGQMSINRPERAGPRSAAPVWPTHLLRDGLPPALRSGFPGDRGIRG